MRHLGGYLGQCWLEDWIFRRIFGHVGAKIVNKMCKMATKRGKMGVGRAAANFDRRDEQGAGSLKRLEVLVELMHWRETSLHAECLEARWRIIWNILIYCILDVTYHL